MNKEEIIEMAKQCASHKTCDNCKFSNFSDGETDCNTVLAKYIVDKENEPAPAGTDTSSKKNYYQLNDNTKLKICQEVLLKAVGELEFSTYAEEAEYIKKDIFQTVGGLKMLLNIIKAGDDNV